MAGDGGPRGTTGDGDAPQPPPLFDKGQFRQKIAVQALRIPTKQCQQYMTLFSKHLLNKPRLKNLADVAGDPQHKLLLLGEDVTAEELVTRTVSHGGEERSVAAVAEEQGLAPTQAELEVDYSYWPTQRVLQRLLPEGMEIPSSFETVGHIAHLNLRDEQLPFKSIIGQVLLDKNPRIRSVVNKIGSIETEYRVFPMEVLAGEESTETEVKQHGLRFRLDFAQVYWNSRLENEHHRLVGGFKPGEVVLDVMAGIGPFAVPAAKGGCMVYANDLNPASYHYLCTNIRLNKVAPKVCPFAMDGREFIRLASAGQLELGAAAEAGAAEAAAAAAAGGGKGVVHGGPAPKAGGTGPAAAAAAAAAGPAAPAAAAGGKPLRAGGPGGGGAAAPWQAAQQAAGGRSAPFRHVVMNLPATAVEFLDAFRGALDPGMWAGRPLPLVHVYAFAKGGEQEDLAGLRQRVEAALGAPLPQSPACHMVRDVSPNKRMYCLSFPLPEEVAFGPGSAPADTPAAAAEQEEEAAAAAAPAATLEQPAAAAASAGGQPAEEGEAKRQRVD